MGRVLLGIILGVVLVPLSALAYLNYGQPPVAVSDAPWPYENYVRGLALQSRIEYEETGNPPIKANGDTFVAGAHIYAQECAVCHGFHGQASRFGLHMAPQAPLLWEKHGNNGAIGVSDDSVGATHWKIANGIRMTGMPAFKNLLTPAQIWQVSVLLANANKPLPPEAVAILRGESEPAPASDAADGSGAGTDAFKPPTGMKLSVSRGAN